MQPAARHSGRGYKQVLPAGASPGGRGGLPTAAALPGQIILVARNVLAACIVRAAAVGPPAGRKALASIRVALAGARATLPARLGPVPTLLRAARTLKVPAMPLFSLVPVVILLPIILILILIVVIPVILLVFLPTTPEATHPILPARYRPKASALRRTGCAI